MESIGQTLRQSREESGLTIKQVSDKTKIRPQFISSIENDEFNVLPGVYAKSFIKTYAIFLHFGEEEITEMINIFNSKMKDFRSTKKSSNNIVESPYGDLRKKEKIAKYSQKTIINYIIYSTMAIALFALLYFALFTREENSANDNDINFTDTPDTAVIDNKNNLLSWFEKPDSLILEASATDTAWIRIEIDGKSSDQFLMYNGMSRRWAAKDFFIIGVGNVGAVQFTRNGQLLEPFGSKGSVVRNVKITADKVENSSVPWNKNPNGNKRRYKKPQKEDKPKTIDITPVNPDNLMRRNTQKRTEKKELSNHQ